MRPAPGPKLVALLAAALVAVPASVAAADAPTAPTEAPASAAADGPPFRVAVDGAVENPGSVGRPALSRLPQDELTTTYTSAGVPETHAFTGPLLEDVLSDADPSDDPSIKNDLLVFAVRVTATDGYRAVVSWGEIDPGFADTEVLLALTQDGQTLARPRLVVPGDQRGGRFVTDVRRVRLLDLGDG